MGTLGGTPCGLSQTAFIPKSTPHWSGTNMCIILSGKCQNYVKGNLQGCKNKENISLAVGLTIFGVDLYVHFGQFVVLLSQDFVLGLPQLSFERLCVDSCRAGWTTEGFRWRPSVEKKHEKNMINFESRLRFLLKWKLERGHKQSRMKKHFWANAQKQWLPTDEVSFLISSCSIINCSQVKAISMF